ncbi:hypothetical protein JCM9957A_26730 [Kineosporia succinea]
MRAGVFSACAVSLSAVAHVFAGGTPPTPVLLIALALLLAPMAAVAAGRLRSGTTVGITMVAVQAGLHELFGLFGPAAGCVQMSSHLGHPGAPTGALVCHDESMAAMSSDSPLMTLTHLSAAALLGLLLSHGEWALWRMLSWILPTLPALSRPVPIVARRRRATSRSVPPVRPEPLTGAVGRRGPPRSAATFA